MSSLSDEHLKQFRRAGHVTVPGVFGKREMDRAIEDAHTWGDEFMRSLDEGRRKWFLDPSSESGQSLRKLDNPVYHRPFFRQLAEDSALVAMVEQIIGQGVSVFFSQIFFKPPEGAGPKPVHQDNFYFGPDDSHAMVTAWLALDDATIENGCLQYCDGSHLRDLLPHQAPDDRPFDLQVSPEASARYPITPASVPRGGVSFHHGFTLHQSSANHSTSWRRAAAFHYLRNDASCATPALSYDVKHIVRITD